jgi:hypothetical protein
MKRIYISGAVSDVDYGEAQARFNAAQAMLEARGRCKVVNPLKVVKWAVDDFGTRVLSDECFLRITHRETGHRREAHPDEFWRECMGVCLHELLKCDTIYMLNNWRTSKGARIELAVAVELGLEILMQGVIK